MNYKEYWKGDALKNITVGGSDNPEGFDVLRFLHPLIPEDTEKLVEIGCGHGRLCQVVPPSMYLGLDINPGAVATARDRHPEYTFQEINVDSEYPEGDVCLAYTVFLHIDDVTLRSTLSRIRDSGFKHIIVAEILGHEWRRKGKPPVFNRNLVEYIRMMVDVGYVLTNHGQRRYAHYAKYAATKNTFLQGLVFSRDRT